MKKELFGEDREVTLVSNFSRRWLAFIFEFFHASNFFCIVKGGFFFKILDFLFLFLVFSYFCTFFLYFSTMRLNHGFTEFETP